MAPHDYYNEQLSKRTAALNEAYLWQRQAYEFATEANRAAHLAELAFISDAHEMARNHGRLLSHLNLTERRLAEVALHQIVGNIQSLAVGKLEWLYTVTDNLATVLKNRGPRMHNLYSRVAAEGRNATIEAYEKSHGRGLYYREKDKDSFRRYSGGAMLRVLEGGQWYRVSSDGILWILPAVFDSAARQWYRLNFGAAPASQKSVASTKMTFFGQNIGEGPNMNKYPRSGSFFLPPGVWSSELHSKTPKEGLGSSTGFDKNFANKSGGRSKQGQALMQFMGSGVGLGTAFYPAGAMGNSAAAAIRAADAGGRVTRGIVGSRFLDEGLQAINRALPVAMEVLVKELVDDSVNKAGATTKRGLAGLPGGAGRDFKKISAEIEEIWLQEVKNSYKTELRIDFYRSRYGYKTAVANFEKAVANQQAAMKKAAAAQAGGFRPVGRRS